MAAPSPPSVLRHLFFSESPPSWFPALAPSPETIVLLLAVIIGGSTGLVIVLFHYLIDLFYNLALVDLAELLAPWGTWTVVGVPILGGAIVGLLRWRKVSFGADLKTLLADDQGITKVNVWQPIAKIFAAAVSLGTGASLGPEGPSVEAGGSIGMFLGQVLQVSRERQKLLLGAGAAAGLAAGFNAPIAGVFFALELVLGATFTTSAIGIVLLAAVVSAFVAQIGLGGQPAFNLPAYDVRSLLELPFYIGLGVLASLTSRAYTATLQQAKLGFSGQLRGWHWLAVIPRPAQPLLGGLVVGLAALAFPQILGTGYETIEAILQDVDFSAWFLAALVLVKLLTTAVSLGSGFVGGIFAPALFLGAALGACYGKVLGDLIPPTVMTIADPPAYAMVGMAAVLAGSVRAPLTAILLLFEMTRDYRIVLPLMAAVGLSVWLVERLKKSTNKPAPEPEQPTLGLDNRLTPSQMVLQEMFVEEAMQPAVFVLGSKSVLEVGLLLTQQNYRSVLVVDDQGQLVGIVTLQDINRAIALTETNASYLKQNTVQDICTRDLINAYPDETLAEATTRMGKRGVRQLPVVDRSQPQKVLGLVDQDQIALNCSIAVIKKALNANVPLPLAKQEPTLLDATLIEIDLDEIDISPEDGPVIETVSNPPNEKNSLDLKGEFC